MSEHPTEHVGARRRPTWPRPITALVGLVVLAAVPVGIEAALLEPAAGQRGGFLAWIALAATFAVSEVFVVHVHVRRDSHSFSLAEVPLVLGLFLVTPFVLLLAAIGGVASALVLHRRQQPTKVAFNLAKLVLELGLALAAFRWFGIDSAIPDNRAALEVFATTLACSVLGALLVSLVIATAQSSVRGIGFVSTLPVSLFGTVTATSLGLVGVTMTHAAPATIWLLVIPVAGCYAAYVAWTQQSRRLESLGYLYRTAQVLQEHASIDDAIVALLAETRQLLKTHSVELVYRPSPDAAMHARFTAGSGGEVVSGDDELVDRLLSLAGSSDSAALLAVADHDALVGVFSADAGVCIVAPLTIDGVAIGALLVSPPLSEVARFGEDERRLVDTTARALSVSLENGALERSLGQLRTLEEQLSHQAFHDTLTQLPNRARFVERVSEVAAEASESTTEFALLFIDLDDFKTVNDSLGHAAGDALLVEVSSRIESCLRTGDLAARLGGDEFAVLLPNVTDPLIAADVADRILRALSEPVTIAGQAVKVSASIGVARSDGDTDPATLLEGADVAMYSAKAAGKGQAVSFHATMHSDMVSRHQLLQDVQGAAERGELSVEYQPIVNLRSGRVDSAEALIRWDHPQRGRIRPDVFIRLAEENRAIRDITALVLEDACTQLARHAAALLPSVNINVSGRDLAAVGFADTVARALSHHGIAPERLVCEVTESLLLGGEAIEAVRGLRDVGVRISLDDFGTGYSSLHMLRELPLDQLKIAQTFVDNVELDPRAQAFVQAIATLGATLDLEVVAEGVERPGQVTALRVAGCDCAQGYVFARPAPADDLARRLSDLNELGGPPGRRSARDGTDDRLADWIGMGWSDSPPEPVGSSSEPGDLVGS